MANSTLIAPESRRSENESNPASARAHGPDRQASEREPVQVQELETNILIHRMDPAGATVARRCKARDVARSTSAVESGKAKVGAQHPSESLEALRYR